MILSPPAHREPRFRGPRLRQEPSHRMLRRDPSGSWLPETWRAGRRIFARRSTEPSSALLRGLPRSRAARRAEHPPGGFSRSGTGPRRSTRSTSLGRATDRGYAAANDTYLPPTLRSLRPRYLLRIHRAKGVRSFDICSRPSTSLSQESRLKQPLRFCLANPLHLCQLRTVT